MNFSFHENLEPDGAEIPFEISPAPPVSRRPPKASDIHLFTEKMAVPVFEDHLARPRLNELLDKNLNQFSATLVTGRTGTGKTALAAGFSRRYRRVAWLSVEPPETDWEVFFRYFLESFDGFLKGRQKRGILREIERAAPQTVAPDIENLLARVDLPPREKPFLIVIDNLHNVFDAAWFAEFFTTLVYALTPDAHLIMLSRSNPPLPLWRLRSKQVLGVVDEKLLAFTLEETEELFEKLNLPKERAGPALGRSFGRISRLKEYVDRSDR